jgi:hypothetical protein
MRISSGVLLVAIMCLAGPALAQTEAQREACKADFEKYCPGVMPGGGRIIECLSKHVDQLTPACQTVVKESTPKSQ